MANILICQGALASPMFDTSEYKETCGGTVYPQCDSSESNQLTIYKKAEALAAQKNLDIILILGADWCPPCNTLEKALRENPDVLKVLEGKLLIVPLSGDLNATSSSKELMDYVGVNIVAYPTLFRINKKDKNATRVFLNSYSEINTIVSGLSQVYNKSYLVEEAQKIVGLSSVLLGQLDKPVDLNEKFGQYPYFKTGGFPGFRSESKVDKLLNAGIARIHAFHYIDAVRCFKEATKLEPTNSLAKSFLAMSYVLFGGSDKSAMVLANLELSEVRTNSLWDEHKAWVNFAKAYVFERTSNLTGVPFSLTTKQALAELLVATERDVEALTLGQFLADGAREGGFFTEALLKEPNHVGANHYLIHYAEAGRDFYRAAEYAKVMATIAADSAHAQHMYGHILPRLKKWKEAEAQFHKADKIHSDWATKYGFEKSYDWHFSHNLDLMGATYVGLGKSQEALEAFKTSCPFDSRACSALLKISASTGDQGSIDALYSQWAGEREVSTDFKLYFERYKIEADLENILSSDKSRIQTYLNSESKYFEEVDRVVKKMLQLKLSGNSTPDEKLVAEVKSAVSLYAADRLGCSSFDGWGKGMLDLLRLWKVASSLGYTKISNTLSNLLKDQLGLDITEQLKN